MAGTANVALRDAKVEIVALHIYEIAYRTMEVITRQMVDRELGRLRSHPMDCRCAEPCGIAREVSASRTFWTARMWQNSITVKQVQADHPHPGQEPLPTHRRWAAVRDLLHQTARPTPPPVACRRPAPRPATTTKSIAHHRHSRDAIHRHRQTAAQSCLKTQDKSQRSSDQGSLATKGP